MEAIETLKKIARTRPMPPVERERTLYMIKQLERWRDYDRVMKAKK